MPEAKPFRVEVEIRTPQIEVWRALTEPDQVGRWFGWDYAGLDGEIELMFVANARHEPPDRILMFEGEDQSAIEVEADGAHTIVRAVYPASPSQRPDAASSSSHGRDPARSPRILLRASRSTARSADHGGLSRGTST